jgi:hypothetical protein
MPKKVRLTVDHSGTVKVEGRADESCVGWQHPVPSSKENVVDLKDVVELHEEKRGTGDKR